MRSTLVVEDASPKLRAREAHNKGLELQGREGRIEHDDLPSMRSGVVQRGRTGGVRDGEGVRDVHLFSRSTDARREAAACGNVQPVTQDLRLPGQIWEIG